MSILASFWDFGWDRVIIWKIVRTSGKLKFTILDISYSSSNKFKRSRAQLLQIAVKQSVYRFVLNLI